MLLPMGDQLVRSNGREVNYHPYLPATVLACRDLHDGLPLTSGERRLGYRR